MRRPERFRRRSPASTPITCCAGSPRSRTRRRPRPRCAAAAPTWRARGLPWLVACDGDGQLLGYAYAAPYRLRSAYRYTLEDSIYVAHGAMRRGIGRALLDRARRALHRRRLPPDGRGDRRQRQRRLDRRCTTGWASAASASCRRSGFKFGRWVDSVLMQRAARRGREHLAAGGRHQAALGGAKKKGPCARHGPSLGRKRLEDVRQTVGRRPCRTAKYARLQCTMQALNRGRGRFFSPHGSHNSAASGAVNVQRTIIGKRPRPGGTDHYTRTARPAARP